MSQGLDPQTHNLISSHQTRASNGNNNYKIKNGVTSFVVSHENHEQEPISVFSMSSSSSQEISNVICSDQDLHHHQVPAFDITLPNNAISTVDHHHHHQHQHQQHHSSSSSTTTPSTAWTLKGQINSSHNIDNNFHQQYNYNIPSSSSSSHMDVQNPSRSCTLPDHDFGIWGPNFEPSFETPRLLEANEQLYSMEGHDHDHIDNHDHHNGQMTKQLQHNDHEKDGQIIQNNERSVEKYSSFDLGFMESALMSDIVMCTNDFSSMEYDIAWNY